MTVAIALGLALLGAFLRLLFGGGPHVASPDNPNVKIAKGWVTRPLVYLFGIFWAFMVLWMGAAAGVALWVPLVIAVLVMAAWSPGHGSWLSPGNGSADDEDFGYIVRPLGKLFGLAQGSAWYCHMGMAIRYGLCSVLVGTAAGFLIGSWSLPYMLSGFAVGLVSYVGYATGLTMKEFKPWFDPHFHNGPLEVGVGAITFASLLLL